MIHWVLAAVEKKKTKKGTWGLGPGIDKISAPVLKLRRALPGLLVSFGTRSSLSPRSPSRSHAIQLVSVSSLDCRHKVICLSLSLDRRRPLFWFHLFFVRLCVSVCVAQFDWFFFKKGRRLFDIRHCLNATGVWYCTWQFEFVQIWSVFLSAMGLIVALNPIGFEFVVFNWSSDGKIKETC